MLSHVFVGVTDFPRSLAFYTAVMTTLGLELKFSDPEIPWAGWKQPTADRPLFLIGHAYNGEPANPGNGQMIALLAKSRDIASRSHATALAERRKVRGTARFTPRTITPTTTARTFRDPDGNKICVCCHRSE